MNPNFKTPPEICVAFFFTVYRVPLRVNPPSDIWIMKQHIQRHIALKMAEPVFLSSVTLCLMRIKRHRFSEIPINYQKVFFLLLNVCMSSLSSVNLLIVCDYYQRLSKITGKAYTNGN